MQKIKINVVTILFKLLSFLLLLYTNREVVKYILFFCNGFNFFVCFFLFVFCIKKRLSTIFIFTFASCLRLYFSKAEWKDFLNIKKKKSLAPFYKQKSKHSVTIISRSINVNVGLVISLCHYLPCSQVTKFCSRALFSRVSTRET